MPNVAPTPFELSQLKLAKKHYRKELDKGFPWQTIGITGTVIFFGVSALFFSDKLIWLPVIAIMVAGMWLYAVLSDRPKKKKTQLKLRDAIDQMLNNGTIEKTSYSVKQGLRLEAWSEIQMFIFELTNGKTLILSDPGYNYGGVLYFGKELNVYENPLAYSIFGCSLTTSGEPVPVNTVIGDFYADIFVELLEGETTLVDHTLDQITELALTRP